jgi:hypothetical protein
MDRAMMRSAERHRELVARLAAQRARLHKSDVMGVRRLAAAQQAGLLGPTALERLAEGLTRCKYSEKTAGTVHTASATAGRS